MKLFFAVAAILISSPLLAQSDTTELEAVNVTASKFDRKTNETGRVIITIGPGLIEKNVGRTVGDLLNQQAGVTIAGANNNPGTNQDVYVRGAALGKTLILIDGVPLYDASSISTAFDLNTISLENVERIEIIKGAQSTLYGSDAVAGVINIIMKKTGLKPWDVNLAAGSYGTYRGSASVNGRHKLATYRLTYTQQQSKGFSSAHDSTGSNFNGKGFDRDGQSQTALDATLGTTLGKFNVQGYSQYSYYKTDLDAGLFTDDADFETKNNNFRVGLRTTGKVGGIHTVFHYHYNHSRRTYLDDSVSVGGFNKYSRDAYSANAHFAEVFLRYPVNKTWTLTAGLDYRFQNTNQELFAISSFGPYESALHYDSAWAGQTSLSAALIVKPAKGFIAEAGARVNRHSIYGHNFTYTINPAYIWNEKWKIFLHAGSAYKVPSLYQLYDSWFGNRELKPEQSRTVEGGIELMATHGWRGSLVYFDRFTRNGIDFHMGRFRYFNYNRQRDHGAEAELGWKNKTISVSANYGYVTGSVNTLKYEYDPSSWSYQEKGDTTFNNLFRRPAHVINTRVEWQTTARLQVSGHFRWVDERREGVFEQQPVLLAPYHTVDLYSQYQLSPAIRLFADLRNIFDTRYFDIRGYNSRRFHFMAGLSLRI